MQKHVVVKFQFEGIHCWPKCPIEEVAFLRSKHRHIFHVKAVKEVSHNDRDVEIIWLKRQMEEFVYSDLIGDDGYDLGSLSCEDIAEILIKNFGLSACEVLEDGENGAYLVQDIFANRRAEKTVGLETGLKFGFSKDEKNPECSQNGCWCHHTRRPESV